MPISLGMTIFGKDLILLLFKTSFISAVLPLQILLIGAVVRGIWMSIGSIFSAIGRVDLGYKIPPLTAIPNILLNYTLIPRYGIVGAAIATTLSFLINFTVSVYLAKRIVHVPYDVIWFGKAITLLFATIVLFYLFTNFINYYLLGIVLFISYTSLTYTILLKKEDREYITDIIITVRNKNDK